MKSRCHNCNKKTLYINECKCLKSFCLNCLPFFNHTCCFNWQHEKKDTLTKTNPKILAVKVQNI